MESLTSLKIGIDNSVTSYTTEIETNILEYLEIKTSKLEEKFLFTYLEINNENKVEKLIKIIYFKLEIPKIIMQIVGNKNIVKKIVNYYIKDCRIGMRTLVMIMTKAKYNKLYNMKILEHLSSFQSKRKNRAIICKENETKFDDIEYGDY